MRTLILSSPLRLTTAVLVLALATILGALAFEHLGGYAPCPLCLEQRYAYYVGIPALGLALVLLASGHRWRWSPQGPGNDARGALRRARLANFRPVACRLERPHLPRPCRGLSGRGGKGATLGGSPPV
jgi:hypothetical protein